MLCLNCAFAQKDIVLPSFLYEDDNIKKHRQHVPLTLEMTPWFHEHPIVRHSIDNQQQWVCSCEDPDFEEKAIKLGYFGSKCESQASQ